MLKSGYLLGSKSGTIFSETLGEDPGWIIYSVGDERNPDDPGAGMSGTSRDATCDTPVPGELFTLNGNVDEETCNELYGEGEHHPLGSETFQTVGFMGGEVSVVGDYWRFQVGGTYYYSEEEVEGATLVTMYTVATGFGDAFIPACDNTEYTVGEWVALAKIGTEFPTEEPYGQRSTVTDDNVPTVELDEYVIVPFEFAGA